MVVANALGLIPTSGDNTYRVGGYRLGSAASVVVPPTVLTAADKANVQDTVSNAPNSGGGTNMTAGFNLVVSSFADAGGLGDTSLGAVRGPRQQRRSLRLARARGCS